MNKKWEVLEDGDVLLALNINNELSKLIAEVTHSQYSHAFMYIGNGFIVESTFGGVQISPLKKYDDGHHHVISVRHKTLSAEERQKVRKSALKYLGKKYGYPQLLWYLLARMIGKSEDPKWQLDLDKNGMVCSEAIARAYEDNGFRIKDGLEPYAIEPVDFVESEHFVRIF